MRVDFTHGATSISMLTAKEWPGLLFVIFQVLLLEEGKLICAKCFQTEDVPLDNDAIDSCRLGYKPNILADIPDECKDDYIYASDDEDKKEDKGGGATDEEVEMETVEEDDDNDERTEGEAQEDESDDEWAAMRDELWAT